jgi:hypothetical protein
MGLKWFVGFKKFVVDLRFWVAFILMVVGYKEPNFDPTDLYFFNL